MDFTDPPMSDSHNADPVRDLNNFLREGPEGNLTKDFKWSSTKEGPEHDTPYHVTALCKYRLFDGASPFFSNHHLYDSPGSEHWGRAWPFHGGRETDSIYSSPGIPEVLW